MITSATNGSSSGSFEGRPAPRGSTTLTGASSLEALVGGHPDALRALFGAGRSADPDELGDAPRGRLLVLEPTRDVHLLVRPLVQAFGARDPLWQGKRFDRDGSGANLVLGRPVARFMFEVGPSDLDGAPALILSYDHVAHGNPWPLRNVRDELRMVGEGVAMGPVHFSASGHGARKVLAWFGLERVR